MTLRSLKTAIRKGEYELNPQRRIEAPTDFQVRRLTYAVAAARLYFGSDFKTAEIAKVYGVTDRRMQMKIWVGVRYMQQAGEIRWVEPAPSPQVSSQGHE